jgi:hypothetical protein
MRNLVLLGSCVTFLSLAPGQEVTRIYQSDTSQVDDGEIWGSTRHLFFFKDVHIRVTESYSRSLAKELLRVKGLLAKTKNSKAVDYNPYAYTFILASQDTLYTDSHFYRWRCGNRCALVTNTVKSCLSTHK